MKKIAFLLAFFYMLTAYSQVDIGNNLVTGSVDTSRNVQNIIFKSRVVVPKNALVINVGYNIPMLQNPLMRTDFWTKKIGTGIDFSIDYRKHFQKRAIEDDEIITAPTSFAFGIGVGASFINKAIVCEKYSETLENFADIDLDIGDINLNFLDVKEKYSLLYVDIPLYLEMGKLSQIKISTFLKLGVKASLLVFKKFDYSGNFTSTGNYPYWQLQLNDIPILGYYNNENCFINPETMENPELKLAPFVIWGTFAAGINFPFSSFEKNKIATWIFRVSAKADYSITPVSKALADSYFHGSSFNLFQTNMMGGKGTRIFSAGLTLSLIYCM
jgi:hypothetical protein